MHLLLRYTQALITQKAQTAVCNRHHSVDQQLCRWLLLSLDRLSGNELSMTQELIANMLGVRREGVTEAAGKLQRLNLIKYGRGHITVLDRPGLERHVCECYEVVKRETDRLLPRQIATWMSGVRRGGRQAKALNHQCCRHLARADEGDQSRQIVPAALEQSCAVQ